MEH
ncbi:unnamed protein product, partial [Adineta steineri]|jgi:hypothetical protein